MIQDEFGYDYNDPPNYAESSDVNPTDFAMGLHSKGPAHRHAPAKLLAA